MLDLSLMALTLPFIKVCGLSLDLLFLKLLAVFINKVIYLRKLNVLPYLLFLKNTTISSLANYKTISLCNTFYKIIANILTTRMKPLMPFII